MDKTIFMHPSTGYLLLALFSVLWIGLGIHLGRRSKDLEGFTVAGRNVGLALASATAAATWITSNTIMLAPQFALQLGVLGMLAYCTASIGLFLFAPVAYRIRRLMPEGYTSAEYIRLRYGKLAHLCFMVISLFYSCTWLVSMAIAGGVLLQSLSGVPYFFGMTAILGVCVVYTVFGGMFAVIGTDFLQTVIILIGVIILGVCVMLEAPPSQIYSSLLEKRPLLLSVTLPAALIALFNNLLFGIGEVFHSNVWWSRVFSFRKDVTWKAYALSGLLWLPIPVAAGCLGLAAPALGINITRPDTVGPVVAAQILGSTGAIVVFVVVFGSLASSLDSLLAATGDLLTHEILKPILRDRPELDLREAAGWVVAGLGVLTWVVCLPYRSVPGASWVEGEPIGSLATVLFFAGPMVGATIVPIVAGLYSGRPTAWHCMLSLGLGSVLGLIAYFQVGWYSGALVGAAVSCLVTATAVLHPIRPVGTVRWHEVA